MEKTDEIYYREKGDFLIIAMKLNQNGLENASEVADSENKALIKEIVNPTPGLVIDDGINVDTQFSFQNSDLDTSFTISNTLKVRLGEILDDARKKVSSLNIPGEATDDRKDFEVNIPESEMIVFKSSSVTFPSVEKKELKTMLNKIIEDLNLNLKHTLMSKSNKTETRQKITLSKNFNKRFDTVKKSRH